MDRQQELALAKSHVERGERLVARQLDVIARLSDRGLDLELAHQLLGKLEVSLAGLRDHLATVQREADAEARVASWRRDASRPLA